MPRRATVLLFGPAREAAGTGSLAWPVPPEGTRAGDLVRAIGTAHPGLAPTLRVSRFLLNGEVLAQLTRRVRPGDEFAVHPPYGGG
jgi:molybdopterin converting factor small subunit